MYYSLPYEQHLKILQRYNYEISKMLYGEYMDAGDGLGYDEIAPYNEGYEQALDGILDTIWSGVKTVGKTIGTGAKYVYSGAKYVGKQVGTAAKYVYTKTPQLLKSAYTKVIKPVAQATYKYVVKPAAKGVSWVYKEGKAAGKFVLVNGAWAFQTVFGQPAQAPAGAEPPSPFPQSAVREQPQQEVQQVVQDKETGYSYNTSTGAWTDAGGNSVPEEAVPEEAKAAIKGNNTLLYAAAAAIAALMLI